MDLHGPSVLDAGVVHELWTLHLSSVGVVHLYHQNVQLHLNGDDCFCCPDVCYLQVVVLWRLCFSQQLGVAMHCYMSQAQCSCSQNVCFIKGGQAECVAGIPKSSEMLQRSHDPNQGSMFKHHYLVTFARVLPAHP